MKPLWFLFSRQFLNGVKRAVGTPRRLIGILFGLSYFVGFVIRPWDKSPDAFSKVPLPKFTQFPLADLHVGVFIIFALLSMLLSVGIFGFRNTFKPADVDVLFPTPINNRLIMFFRLFRDYWPTFLIPFFLGVFMFKPGQGFFKAWNVADPSGFANAMRGMFMAWILLSLVWVTVGYALSFYLGKNEKIADKVTRISGWVLGLTTAGIFMVFSLAMRAKPEWSTIVETANLLPIKIILILPESATLMTVGAYSGNIGMFLAGAAILLIVIATSLFFATRYSDWMYDQAATRGFQAQTMKDLMQKGDGMGMLAEKARQGKVKKGKIANRLSTLTLRGGWALLYKELIIQARTGFWVSLMFMLMVTMVGVLFLSITPKRPDSVLPIVYLALVGFMGVNMGSATAFNSFVETLRRVEVIKPLPLNARQIAFYEVFSKSIFSIAVVVIPYLIGLIYKPVYWQFHMAGLIAGPMLSVALVSVIFLIVVLFPDFDDPTQRGFRGMMQLLGMVFILAPTVALFGGFLVLKQSPLIPAAMSIGVNAGITFLCATLAGRFYADFNPSE